MRRISAEVRGLTVALVAAGYSNVEIGKIMGVSHQAIGSRIKAIERDTGEPVTRGAPRSRCQSLPTSPMRTELEKQGLTVRGFAERYSTLLGVSSDAIRKSFEAGRRFSPNRCDQYAACLALHPAQIWDNWYEASGGRVPVDEDLVGDTA